jgi:hypothetical protein
MGPYNLANATIDCASAAAWILRVEHFEQLLAPQSRTRAASVSSFKCVR